MERRAFLAAAAGVVAAPCIVRAQQQRKLRVGPQADLAIIYPGLTTATVTRNHGFMVFETLYGLDASRQAVPEMVAGHQVDDDGRTWTLTLRDRLRFHDGEPVRAAGCAASIRRWSRRDQFGKTLMAATAELAATDDRILRVRLHQPYPLLPQALAKTAPYCPFIYPQRLILADPTAAMAEIVGSGPFRFISGERVPGAGGLRPVRRLHAPPGRHVRPVRRSQARQLRPRPAAGDPRFNDRARRHPGRRGGLVGAPDPGPGPAVPL